MQNADPTQVKMNATLNATFEDIQIPSDYVFQGQAVKTCLSTIIYKFWIRRHPFFPFLSIYIPTVLMTLIAYCTLWMPVNNFQDRGTMSLTTLLVLISLYTDSINKLPATTYIKFLDVWYLYCVVYISTIIFVHISSSHLDRIQYVKQKVGWSFPSNEAIIKRSRVIFGLFCFLFNLIYWGFLGIVLVYKSYTGLYFGDSCKMHYYTHV